MGINVVDKKNIIDRMEMMELFLEGYTTCKKLNNDNIEVTFQPILEELNEEPKKCWRMIVTEKTQDGWTQLFKNGLMVDVSHEYGDKIRVFVNEETYGINFNYSDLLIEFNPTNTTPLKKSGRRIFNFFVEEIMDVGRIINFVVYNFK